METIYYDSANKSGIYKIYNKTNGRTYIGSTISFKKRRHQHLRELLKNKHHNCFFQNDFNKCGKSNFVFEVLEVVIGNKKKRIIREQFYLDQYYDGNNQCYNLKKYANGTGSFSSLSLGNKSSWEKKSENEKNIIRKKISKALTGRKLSQEHIESISRTKTGKKLTKKHKKNISKTMKTKPHRGRWFGAVLTEERKNEIENQKSVKMTGIKNPFFGKTHPKHIIEKIRKANLGRISSRRRKIKLTNLLDENKILKFNSITETCYFLNVTCASIDRYIKNKRKHNIWKVEYDTDQAEK